jgi:hypothetical protein
MGSTDDLVFATASLLFQVGQALITAGATAAVLLRWLQPLRRAPASPSSEAAPVEGALPPTLDEDDHARWRPRR